MLVGFFRFILILEMFSSRGSSSSSFPTSTCARDSTTSSMSSPIGATSRCRVFLVLQSALLCHPRHPIADISSQGNYQHRSHCWSLSVSLIGSGRNEKCYFEIDWCEFFLSMPVHQFLKMNSHYLTNFAVNRNHVTTIMSELEMHSTFANDLCSTAQHFVYISESSVQRPEQSVFVVSLELRSSTIRNPFTTGSPMESSISLLLDQCSMGMC